MYRSLCWTLIIVCIVGVQLSIAQADNEWAQWSKWKRLNECLCLRVRTCHSADLRCLKEENCTGNFTDIRRCPSQECKVGGGWLGWSAWSPCSLSCGGGTERRRRLCRGGGAPCPGDGVETRPCAGVPCPQQDEWSPWSRCSAKRDGTRHRSRKCTTVPGSEPCWEKQPCDLCPHTKMELQPAQAKMRLDGELLTFHCQFSSPLSDREGVTIEMTTVPQSDDDTTVSFQSKSTTCGWKLKWTTNMSRGKRFIECVARNAQGDVISKMVAAILSGDLPVLRVPRAKVLAHEGAKATLQCQPTQGAMGAVIRWGRLDGRPLPPHADNQTNGHLQLHSVTLADNGTYVCHAENVAGVANETVILEVVTKPNITIRPDQFVSEYANSSLTVECLADSHPKPSVAWYRESNGSLVLLTRENRTHGDVSSARLVFQAVRKEDEGSYVCFATHKHRSNKATLQLIVNDFDLQTPSPVGREPTEAVASTSSNHMTVTTVGSDNTMATTLAKPSEEQNSPNTTSVFTTKEGDSDMSTLAGTVTPSTVSASTTVPTTSAAPEPTVVTETSSDPPEETSSDTPEASTSQSSVATSPEEETTIFNNEISACAPRHLRCASARCVPLTAYCDGVDDCGDGSDEWNCLLTGGAYPCGADQFMCSSRMGRECIPGGFACDGKRDCGDGSDELGCDAPGS